MNSPGKNERILQQILRKAGDTLLSIIKNSNFRGFPVPAAAVNLGKWSHEVIRPEVLFMLKSVSVQQDNMDFEYEYEYDTSVHIEIEQQQLCDAVQHPLFPVQEENHRFILEK